MWLNDKLCSAQAIKSVEVKVSVHAMVCTTESVPRRLYGGKKAAVLTVHHAIDDVREEVSDHEVSAGAEVLQGAHGPRSFITSPCRLAITDHKVPDVEDVERLSKIIVDTNRVVMRVTSDPMVDRVQE
jgi:hypothetical protein